MIAPKRVALHTWTGEVKKWSHLNDLYVQLVTGDNKNRLKRLLEPADIYVINRELVEWLVNNITWDFDTVIIDELSSFKNQSSKRFKALRRVRSKIRRIVGLTGTPAPNGLIDLWAQIYLLDGGARLGKTVSSYRYTYFRPGRRSGHIVYEWIPLAGAQEQIFDRISDLCISMRAADYIRLPEKIEQTVFVELPKAARSQYNALKKDLVTGEIVADTAAVLANKLLQVANGAVYDEDGNEVHMHDAKLDALEDLIEAANGSPLLVFYNYHHDRDRIMRRFPQAQELDDLEAWNRGEIPLLLVHPASAGHGLNMQYGGSIAVWFGLTWSLELYQQANARLYRQGQTKTVRIYHIVSRGTIDERVLRVLADKTATQNAIIDAVKAEVQE